MHILKLHFNSVFLLRYILCITRSHFTIVFFFFYRHFYPRNCNISVIQEIIRAYPFLSFYHRTLSLMFIYIHFIYPYIIHILVNYLFQLLVVRLFNFSVTICLCFTYLFSVLLAFAILSRYSEMNPTLIVI